MSISPVNSSPYSLPSILRKGGRGVYRGLLSQPFSHLGSEKIVNIKYPPIMLALIAGMGLVYSHGHEVAQPNGDRQGWLKSLIEAGASYLIVDNSGGVFPLWGVGVTAYRAGQKNTTLEKVQEAVKSAIVMSLGYLGIHMGASFSDAATEIEERKMHELLSHPSIDQWLQSDRVKGSADEIVQSLREEILQFRDKSTKSYENHFAVNSKLAKTLKKEMAELTQSIHLKLSQVDEKAFLPLGKEAAMRMDGFNKVLSYSQQFYIQATRRMNPVFGYLVAGLLAGIPLANRANKWVENRFPQLRQMNVPPPVQSHLAKNMHLSGANAHGSPSEALPWVLPALGKAPGAGGH